MFKILVVEDDKDLNKTVCSFLNHSGYEAIGCLDADEHTAYLNGEEISLTNREFSILYKLLSYPKKTFTRLQLMDEFWDADTNTAPRAVDVYMTKSAKEQEEIKKICQKYQSQEEDSMLRLRKLDASVTSKATVIALVLGVAGALMLGTGMSLIMTDLSVLLGMAGLTNMIVGIFAGILGIVLIALAYPAYCKVLKRERKKIAPEILRLADELMK